MDIRRLSTSHFRLDFVQNRSFVSLRPNIQVTGHRDVIQNTNLVLFCLPACFQVFPLRRSHGHRTGRKGLSLIWLVIQSLSRALHSLISVKGHTYHVDIVTFSYFGGGGTRSSSASITSSVTLLNEERVHVYAYEWKNIDLVPATKIRKDFWNE